MCGDAKFGEFDRVVFAEKFLAILRSERDVGGSVSYLVDDTVKLFEYSLGDSRSVTYSMTYCLNDTAMPRIYG